MLCRDIMLHLYSLLGSIYFLETVHTGMHLLHAVSHWSLMQPAPSIERTNTRHRVIYQFGLRLAIVILDRTKQIVHSRLETDSHLITKVSSLGLVNSMGKARETNATH